MDFNGPRRWLPTAALGVCLFGVGAYCLWEPIESLALWVTPHVRSAWGVPLAQLQKRLRVVVDLPQSLARAAKSAADAYGAKSAPSRRSLVSSTDRRDRRFFAPRPASAVEARPMEYASYRPRSLDTAAVPAPGKTPAFTRSSFGAGPPLARVAERLPGADPDLPLAAASPGFEYARDNRYSVATAVSPLRGDWPIRPARRSVATRERGGRLDDGFQRGGSLSDRKARHAWPNDFLFDARAKDLNKEDGAAKLDKMMRSDLERLAKRVKDRKDGKEPDSAGGLGDAAGAGVAPPAVGPLASSPPPETASPVEPLASRPSESDGPRETPSNPRQDTRSDRVTPTTERPSASSAASAETRSDPWASTLSHLRGMYDRTTSPETRNLPTHGLEDPTRQSPISGAASNNNRPEGQQ